MRCRRPSLLVSTIALGLVTFGGGRSPLADFGMIKTRVTLGRMRPPATPLLPERVVLDVQADASIGGAAVDLARGRIERAFAAWGLYRLVDPREDPEATVRLVLRGAESEVRSETDYEDKYVKIGERQEWNEKKKKMEKKDVYGYRRMPVTIKVAEGRADALLEVEDNAAPFNRPLRAAYQRRFKEHDSPPAFAGSRFALRDYLIEELALKAIGVVTFAPDPVQALLATDSELKPGNKLAEAGLFKMALEEWNRHKFRGDKEAARVHNVGVAQEALAYELPPFAPEHRVALEQAKALYTQAFMMDDGERYFAEPLKRIEVSLEQAAVAARIKSDIDAARAGQRRSAREPLRGKP